jgi:DNA-binding transcriptional regulator YiaG
MLMTKRKKPAGNNPWPGRLKALREHYDISQKQAAERIDASLGSWRNWEQGLRTPSPMIVRLLKLTFPEFFRE